MFEGDIVTVSGLSTDTLRDLDGQHPIGFSTSRFALNIGVGTTGTTGIVTSIDVIGDFSPRNISANDILSLSGIGSTNGLPLTENMLILNVDNINGKLRVQREFNGVVGVAHSEGQDVTATNRSITFNTSLDSDVITNVNIPYYFNPIESVALGSTAGVGVGSTVVYTYKVSGNGISSTFVPTQQIFLQGHGFITGQKLLYSNGGGTSLSVYNGISTFNLPNNSFVLQLMKVIIS